MSTSASFASLNGIPKVNLAEHLQQASRATQRGFAAIVSEVFALRRGPGKLTSNEYFYYRLWEPGRSREAKRAFIGKQAQERMHRVCNDLACLPHTVDKLGFHARMTEAGFPTPALLAVVHPSRGAAGSHSLTTEEQVSTFLRAPGNYPLFAKPIDGKYSFDVISVNRYLPSADILVMHDGQTPTVRDVARRLVARPAGFLIQHRLAPADCLQRCFGSTVWTVRVLVLLTPSGPAIHRAVAKIPTGKNPADNFWRPGNMLGAVDLSLGQIVRVVRGTGMAMTVNDVHPDTGEPIIGTFIIGWDGLLAMVKAASLLFPGIRTQSWDIALAEEGPVPLEINWGGDLNLLQLASGAGMLDDVYRGHLRACGYQF